VTEPELSQRSVSFETKGFDESTRSVDVIMSTNALDSYGERIDQSGFDLSRFRSNPVLLAFHNSRDWPLGRCENVRVEAGALQCRIFFASAKANPEAEKCFQLVKEKIINAVSVGMLVRETEMVNEGNDQVCVIRKCELAELSIVAVPANPEALIKRAQRDKQLSDARAAEALTTPTGEQETLDMTDTNKALIADHEKAVADLTEKHANELAHAEARLENATKDIATLTTERDGLVASVKTLTAERDEAKAALETSAKALAESNDKLVELEVDALVGVKILPAEKEEFIELRKSNPALFGKMIEKRGALKLTDKVIPEQAGKASVSAHDALADVFANASTSDQAQLDELFS